LIIAPGGLSVVGLTLRTAYEQGESRGRRRRDHPPQ
jgi:hypothetical protein